MSWTEGHACASLMPGHCLVMPSLLLEMPCVALPRCSVYTNMRTLVLGHVRSPDLTLHLYNYGKDFDVIW
jgi:hypothetical protein